MGIIKVILAILMLIATVPIGLFMFAFAYVIGYALAGIAILCLVVFGIKEAVKKE